MTENVVTLLQDVAPRIGVGVPSMVMAATDRTGIELASIAKRAAQHIAREAEWQLLKTIATITGNGTSGPTVGFTLESDFDRFIEDVNLRSSAIFGPFEFIAESDRWLAAQIQSMSFLINAWTMYGDRIYITPAPANASLVKYWYMSNKACSTSGGAAQETFVADSDLFRLGDELFKRCVTWMWKEDHGQPSLSAQETYLEMLERRIKEDGGPRVIRQGPRRRLYDVELAYPKAVG